MNYTRETVMAITDKNELQRLQSAINAEAEEIERNMKFPDPIIDDDEWKWKRRDAERYEGYIQDLRELKDRHGGIVGIHRFIAEAEHILNGLKMEIKAIKENPDYIEMYHNSGYPAIYNFQEVKSAFADIIDEISSKADENDMIKKAVTELVKDMVGHEDHDIIWNIMWDIKKSRL